MGEPVMVGLLFADRIVEENNGKKVIVGTFNQFNSSVFPAAFPPWCIYAGVTNLVGKHTFALNLVHDKTQQVILPFNGEFESRSNDTVVELIPGVMGLPFPYAGEYVLTFAVDGQTIGSRILYARQIGIQQ